MKKIFLLLSVCSFALLPSIGLTATMVRESSPASSTNSLTGEDIVHRSLAGRGGDTAAAEIKSFHCKGTADFAGFSHGTYEFFASRSDQYRQIFDFGGVGRYEFLFDGQSGWEMRPGIEPKKQSGLGLQQMRDDAAFFGWFDLKTCQSVAYIGETSFQGARCRELKVITGSGRAQTNYYDSSNDLLVGMSESVAVEDKSTLCTTYFFEYRKFAEFSFPTRIRIRTDESELLIRITSLEVNGVDAAVFKAPAESPADLKPSTSPPVISDAEIKNSLEDYIDRDKIAVGLAVGIIDPQGCRVIARGRMGDGNSPEVNGDTLFEIGSITKVFTHLLLHDMVARGDMNMDDPVQKYLPSSVRMPTCNGRQITLWELSMHTSGLPRDMDPPYDVRHLYSFLSNCKLRSEPGERFEYSNLGVALLGHVISLKAGTNYETLVRDRICRPLRMDSTVITMTPELQARRAVGHQPASQKAQYIGLQHLPGAGALFSTANDMLKLASAKLGMTSIPLTSLVKKAVPSHGGGTFGFSSQLSFDGNRGVIVLSNCRNDDLMTQLSSIVINPSPRPAGTVSVDTNLLDRCVGQYRSGEDRLRTVRRVNDRLVLQVLGKPSCELYPLSETNFFNQRFNCRATFAGIDASNRATELIVGDLPNPSWRGIRISGQVLMPAAFPLTDGDCSPRKGSDFQGVWKATVRPWYWPFYSVDVKIRVSEPSPGAFRAELDSRELDVWSLPLAVIYDPPAVTVIDFAYAGSFNGVVNSDHTKVSGRWNVGGHSLNATFQRDK